MNYEKAYKESLEKIQELINKANKQGHIIVRVEDIENSFPELKESEDERIRKAIKYCIKQGFIGYGKIENVTPDECLAWLEKQGKQKPQGKSALEAITEEKVDNSNKIEKPKFHEGDWIVQGCNILKIKCVGNTHYCYETVGGYVDDMLVSEIDSLYHLWTIQDAKDGDVVVDKSDGAIGLFQSIGHHPDGGSYNDSSYCFLHCRYDDGFFYADFENGNTIDADDLIPATKEQRDLLFSKMKDASYEWDDKKNELRKIEKQGEKEEVDGFDAELNALLKKYEHLSKKELQEPLEFYLGVVRDDLDIVREEKPKWNGADDYNVQCCIAEIENDIANGRLGRNKELIEWLKSLKQKMEG